jgi:protein kinase C substrate 80K-H
MGRVPHMVGTVCLVLLASMYAPPAASLTPTSGVRPDQHALYAGTEFSCKDGGAKIALAQVNDNYCDCADGSDEPATSACGSSGAQFWCVNKGHHGKYLFASMVNDGVCDCCDGSDEDGTLAQCTNRCEDVGSEIRRQLQRQIELHEAGHLKRAGYAERGAMFREGVVARKAELAGKIAELDLRLGEMETKKAELETITEAQRAEKEAAEQAAREAEEAAQAAKAAEDAAAAGVHAAEDASGAAAVDPVPPQQVDEGQAVDAGVQQVEDDEAHADVDAGAEGQAEEEPAAAPAAAPKTPEQEALDALKDEMRPLEDERKKHTGEADLAGKVLTWDFGPDNAFMALYDKCFSKEIQQYQYEVCLFRNAAQKDGGSRADLGKWGRWDTDGAPYSKMIYENGGHCWNGPARSLKVSLVCGEDEFIVSVQEPATCVYEMEFMTPLACSLDAVCVLYITPLARHMTPLTRHI